MKNLRAMPALAIGLGVLILIWPFLVAYAAALFLIAFGVMEIMGKR